MRPDTFMSIILLSVLLLFAVVNAENHTATDTDETNDRLVPCSFKTARANCLNHAYQGPCAWCRSQEICVQIACVHDMQGQLIEIPENTTTATKLQDMIRQVKYKVLSFYHFIVYISVVWS